ncbi:MAG: zinc ribbon domain-containing protein [Candidatus Methanomethylophilaceae archaeon]|jgi:hypothetical protein|nr:zinc ribbon domain-containing protein [Candidatus Methanomethylophilaceae archaeon]NLF33453.1 transcriptional regulator [Thermoplasmatales archaeon]
MEEKYCQSCSMPMTGAEDMYGTNADGSRSEDYCLYCYENGAFTCDCTMNEMLEHSLPYMVEANPDLDEDSARKILLDYFPMMKRWKQ